jgi:hypothetical protein
MRIYNNDASHGFPKYHEVLTIVHKTVENFRYFQIKPWANVKTMDSDETAYKIPRNFVIPCHGIDWK